MSKAAAAASLPPPPPEVAHLVDQLQRHHLAPDASLLSSCAHSDLLQVRYLTSANSMSYLRDLTRCCLCAFLRRRRGRRSRRSARDTWRHW